MCFNKRGIFTGDLNFYCLVCEVIMKDEHQAMLHLMESLHDQHLALTYMSYPEHGIRKIKDKHYCEYCNCLMHGLKVNAHLRDETHLMYKSKEMRYTPKKIMKRENDALIAFNEYVVSDNAWHSIIDHTCLLCDYTDITNFDLHKNSQNHIMKLIQMKTQHMDNHLFRKFNEDMQCLICNILIPFNQNSEHFSDQKHLKNYNQARKDRNSLIEVIVINEDEDVKPSLTYEIVIDELTEPSPSLVNNHYTAIDLSLASTNYRKQLKRISLENLINPTITGELYCRVCEVRFPKTLIKVSEHVEDRRHIQLLNQNLVDNSSTDSYVDVEGVPDTYYSAELMNTFIKETHFWKMNMGDMIIINNSFCINIFSMMTCTKLETFLYCNVCQFSFMEELFSAHTESSPHTIKLSMTMVVTCIQDEFIRELRPGVFHCGYCNMLKEGWGNLIAHLHSSVHRDWKCQADWFRSEFSKVPSVLPEYYLGNTVGLIKLISQLQ